MSHSHLYLRLFLALLICFSATFVGCDDDAASDNTSGAEGDAADTANSDLDGAEGVAECADEYFFVRIDDLTPKGSKGVTGVELDGVKLIKYPEDPDEPRVDFLPAEVMAYQAGANADLLESDSTDPNNVLLLNSVSPDGTTCSGDPNVAVSLGGEGGYIVLRFEKPIEAGDELLSFEIGNCNFDGSTAKPDPIFFKSSVSTEPEGPWVQIFEVNIYSESRVGGAVPELPCPE